MIRAWLFDLEGTLSSSVERFHDAYCSVLKTLEVVSAEGENIASIAGDTPAEAPEAYKHPFARFDVPDVFSSAKS